MSITASASVEMPSTDCVVCDMCESGQEATRHCNDCLMNLCDQCVTDVHHKFVVRGRHHITSGVADFNTEFELCPTHDQKMAFFCRSCSMRVCPECELESKTHVMHQVVSLDRYIGQEKERLLDTLDEVTNRAETISYLPADIKTTALKIELKWLERREQIRQEFTSLYEIITARQQELLTAMDKEVTKSLQELKVLHNKHASIMDEACQLSDECISAVQHLPRNDFMKKYPQFMNSFDQLEHQVSRVMSPDDHMPAFLAQPFSLYKEKVHLDHSLRFPVFCCLSLKPREYNKFIPLAQLQNKLTLQDLLHTPASDDLPPSSVMLYDVEVYRGNSTRQVPVWQNNKRLKATDTVFNGPSEGVKLEVGCLYMLKVMPCLMCTKQSGLESALGRTVTFLIITEQQPGVATMDKTKVHRQEQDSNNNHVMGRGGFVFVCPDFPANHTHTVSHVRCVREVYDAILPKKPAVCPCPLDQQTDGRLQCCTWYQSHFSFEEARLLEDRGLQLYKVDRLHKA